MKRRVLLASVAGASFSPGAVRAQRKAMPVIGYLGNMPGPAEPGRAMFHQGLSEAGYVEGQNVAIEYRWAEGHYDRLPTLAAELVGRRVDVIVSILGPTGALAAKGATSTIPIVFLSGDDPVERGLVTSLARPGGNITGVSLLAVELTAKQFELLSELISASSAIAMLVNPNNANAERVIRDGLEAARVKRVQLHILKAATDMEIDRAFVALAELHAGGLVVGADPFFYYRRDQLVALAARYAVPAIYERREFAAAGGLISYGTSLLIALRQLGTYTGKILNGAKPADLPVEQQTKYELVINLKAARALGLAFPPSILARADEVIE